MTDINRLLQSIPVFRHDSRAKVGYDSFLVVAVLAATLMASFRLTFGALRFDASYWLITAIYFLDIAYSFNQSVKKGLVVHASRRSIARQYLRGWFTFDVLAAFPFSFLFSLVSRASQGELAEGVAIGLGVLHMVKVLKVNRYFRDIQVTLNVNPSLMRLVTFAFWFFTAVNIMSCGWCLIGASEPQRPPFDQYIRAMYWCLTTIATIGYGDYTPNHDSNLQVIYTMVVMIFGVGMYGYIIGNVASLIANIDVARANYMKKMEEIGEFMRTKKLPAGLQGRVRDYYSYLWETRKSVSSVSIVEELPHSLSMDILLYINRAILEKVALFKNANEIFIREVVQLLQPMVFLPDDYIIRQGEFGDCMYFLSNGDVEVLVNGVRVAALGQGSPFGETALIQGEKRMASIRALTYCDVYMLSKKDFDTLRGQYPEFDAQVKKVVEERLKDTAEKTRAKKDTPPG